MTAGPLTALFEPRRFSIAILVAAIFTCGPLRGEKSAADSPNPAGPSVLVPSETEKFTLRHRLTPGQTIRYEVTHVAKTKTRMNGTEEIANVHTSSVRSWQVSDVNADSMTFDHQIDSVAMTQQNGDKPEVRWDSRSGETPPSIFRVVSEQIGTPLATVTIDSKGAEIKRESHAGSSSSLGMGSLTLLLPEKPIAIDETWAVPSEVQARTDDGLVKTIKIRQTYTLKKVKAGVATIAVKSEPLTPIDSEAIKSQVVQQLSNGSIRFDVDNGYLLGKELTWDETVVGFQGPGSMMEYRARMTEELVRDDTVKAATKPKQKDQF